MISALLGKEDFLELKEIKIKSKGFALSKLFDSLLKEVETNFDENLEKKVDEIHDLIETPHSLIRKYLKYTKGNKEKAIDLILNNFVIPEDKSDEKKEEKPNEKNKKDDTIKVPIKKQLSQVEDDLIKIQKQFEEVVGISNEVFFGDDSKNFQIQNEKSLKEAKESKNIHFFCKDEKEALLGTKIKRWKFFPTRTFELTAEEIHFRIAESQFHRFLSTFGNSGMYKLVEVEYIVNPMIVKNFEASKLRLALRHGFLPESMKPVYMFHGTSEKNMENILLTNFLISKVGSTTDMGWYGKGIYFSEFPGTSISYSRGNPYLLLCAVFVGKTYKMNQIQTGCELKEGYDSHISGDGSEVIIFDTDCILPCYKIKWAQTQGTNNQYQNDYYEYQGDDQGDYNNYDE